MATSSSPLNTLCTENGCDKLACYRAWYYDKEKLCSEHYHEYKNTKEKPKKITSKNKKCKLCKKLITNKRNKKYCSATCRCIAMRFVDNTTVCEVTKTAVWQRIQKLLRSSPLGLASINDLGDIYHLYALLSVKKLYEDNVKFKSSILKLKLVHLYPLEDHGLNIMDNILIVPKMPAINSRRVDNNIRSLFCGRNNFLTPPIPIEKSLFHSLAKPKKTKKMEGVNEETLIQLCVKIKHDFIDQIESDELSQINQSPITLPYTNHFFIPLSQFKNDNNNRIIYHHLKSQVERLPAFKNLHLFLDKISTCFQLSDDVMTTQFFELLALSIYHALIIGNSKFFIEEIIQHISTIIRIETNENDAQQQKEQAFQTVVTYINHNFNQSLSTKLSDSSKFIRFYSQFFSQPKSSVEDNHG